eukprot:3280329-Amphidinium_carterae.2
MNEQKQSLRCAGCPYLKQVIVIDPCFLQFCAASSQKSSQTTDSVSEHYDSAAGCGSGHYLLRSSACGHRTHLFSSDVGSLYNTRTHTKANDDKRSSNVFTSLHYARDGVVIQIKRALEPPCQNSNHCNELDFQYGLSAPVRKLKKAAMQMPKRVQFYSC